MPLIRGASSYVTESRAVRLVTAGLLVALVALLDWRIVRNLSLGFLYLFPIMLAADRLSRFEIVALAALCTALREIFSPFHLDIDVLPRSATAFAAFSATGLFFRELARSRWLALEHLRQLAEQMRQREAAEEQSYLLIESSPAAIITTDGAGNILLANSAAHGLLGFEEGALCGRPLEQYLPLPAAALPQPGPARFSQRMAECVGRRRDGSAFLAQVWLSGYATGSGHRTAAVVFDVSEQARHRAETGLQQLLVGTRTAVGAFWHEVRNLCGAMGVLHTNLKRQPALARNEDFEALGSLLEGLQRIASKELAPGPEQELEPVSLPTVLNEVRVVIGPAFEQIGATIWWDIPPDGPFVRADRHGLLQIFLNLAQNARRALAGAPRKALAIQASARNGRAFVRFHNSGRGIAQPERLFRPLQKGADANGLGLYISRALARSFGGDLKYEPLPDGCCFLVELEAAEARATAA